MTYRQIYPSFWTDSKVEDDFTPEDRYFYLYLMTNPHTNICGCYEVSIKQMSRETGYNEDVVKNLINRMINLHKVIDYSYETKEVLLLNWHKYNWTSSDRLIVGVEKSAAYIKNEKFREFVLTLVGSEDRVSIGYPYPMVTSVSVPVTESISDTVKNKNKRPTLEELSAYIKENGYKVDAQRFIDYYESNGWKVGKNSMKDWKAAVRSWNSREKAETKKETSYDTDAIKQKAQQPIVYKRKN